MKLTNQEEEKREGRKGVSWQVWDTCFPREQEASVSREKGRRSRRLFLVRSEHVDGRKAMIKE